MPSSRVIHGRTLQQWLSFCQTARETKLHDHLETPVPQALLQFRVGA
jgi:hypothetical protein